MMGSTSANGRRAVLTGFAFALLLAAGASPARASLIWAEAGEAGQLPSTAQSTIGAGSLDAIRGELAGIDDIDMFHIFIPDLSAFSATSAGPNTEFLDTQLFLFDPNGFGVAANDDTFGGTPPDLLDAELNATIPLGSLSGPPGLYLLAIAEFGDEPVSDSGSIFDLFSALPGEAIGPTGPGGADPIVRWDTDLFSESEFPPFPTSYEIQLTGALPAAAVIPEPSSLALLGIGAIGLVGIGCRRKRARRGSRDEIR